MKIAILSDIHDHVWRLKTVLSQTKDCDALICCGDLCSPFIIDQLTTEFSKDIHIVFGNNDGDLFRITQKALNYKNPEGNPRVSLYGQFFQKKFESKNIAVNHYPDIAFAIAESGQYDLVCYGHNHQAKVETKEATVLVNPGAVMGYDPVNKKDIPATFAVYDTYNGEVRVYETGIDANGLEFSKPYF